jgi:acetyl esterase
MRELSAAQADDLYELITERAGRSLILTSNRGPADWYPLARDQHLPGVACQVLCYPVLDFGQDTESARLFDGVFHSIKLGWKQDHYFAGQPVTAYAAPLRAASLAGLPPALVIGAGRDPLRDDARAYAARLDADGVDLTHVEYDATMHAFLNFCGVLSAGDHAIEFIAARLADTFAGPLGS